MTVTRETTDMQVDELLAHLNDEELAMFAALERMSTDVLPLALAGLPRGTRIWAETYGLIAAAGTEPSLTESGRAAAAAAAARVPEPYADVTVGDLLEQTRQAVEQLAATSPLRVEMPSRGQPVTTTPMAARARSAGQHLGERIAFALGRRERPTVDVHSSAPFGHRKQRPTDSTPAAPQHTHH